MIPEISMLDDEERNVVALERFWAADGYERHPVSSGAEACELARALQPDLILRDG